MCTVLDGAHVKCSTHTLHLWIFNLKRYFSFCRDRLQRVFGSEVLSERLEQVHLVTR